MTVLVLDIGSSSARALLFDDQARLIPGASVQRKYQMETNPPGAATLDAETLRRVVEACVDGILRHEAAQMIRVVGLATFVGNLLGVDAAGQPRTPVYLYADTRCAGDVAALYAQVDADAVLQRTGCRLHSAYHPARLNWLARTEPELFSHADKRVHLWADFASYLFLHWFGAASSSYSVASWSGLLNRRTLAWDHDWLALLSKTASITLPALHDYDHFPGALKSAYAQRWQALQNVPFCLAIGDGAAANVGSGCVDASTIALSLGTTAALRISVPESDHQQENSQTPNTSVHQTPPLHVMERGMGGEVSLPPIPPGLWSYRITHSLHLLGGATSEGGNVYRWARDTLLLPENVMERLAAEPVDGHGLTALPLLAGERSPGWAADATGSIAGLRLSTTPLDIAQALFESLAVRLSLVNEQVSRYALPGAPIIGSGGALSPYLAQLIADACHQPVHVTAETEITSRGVALLALRAIGVDIPFGIPPEIAYVSEPRPEAVTSLRAARERQIALYDKLVRNFYSPD
jgi:gluconokinase